MHDGMPYGRNQGQGQGHSREVDRQSPTGLIFIIGASEDFLFCAIEIDSLLLLLCAELRCF